MFGYVKPSYNEVFEYSFINVLFSKVEPLKLSATFRKWNPKIDILTDKGKCRGCFRRVQIRSLQKYLLPLSIIPKNHRDLINTVI